MICIMKKIHLAFVDLLTTNAGRHVDQKVQMKNVQMQQELLWIFNKNSTMGGSESMDSSGRRLILQMEWLQIFGALYRWDEVISGCCVKLDQMIDCKSFSFMFQLHHKNVPTVIQYYRGIVILDQIIKRTIWHQINWKKIDVWRKQE